jgi:hypothetical protein
LFASDRFNDLRAAFCLRRLLEDAPELVGACEPWGLLNRVHNW